MNSKCFGATLLLSLGVVGAQASTFVYIDSYSNVLDLSQDSNPHRDEHSVTNYAPACLTPTTMSSTMSFGPGAAHAYATASMGVFHEYATSSYPKQGVDEYADASSVATASDSLLVTSSTLAAGTMVSVNFQFVIDGTISVPSSQQSSALFANVTSQLGVSSTSGGSNGNLLLNHTSYDGGAFTLSGSVDATVGSSIDFNYTLGVRAFTDAYSGGPYAITSDFSNTGKVFVDPANSNVTLVSSSGYNYSSVPEPVSSISLGLAALGLARRRRK